MPVCRCVDFPRRARAYACALVDWDSPADAVRTPQRPCAWRSRAWGRSWPRGAREKDGKAKEKERERPRAAAAPPEVGLRALLPLEWVALWQWALLRLPQAAPLLAEGLGQTRSYPPSPPNQLLGSRLLFTKGGGGTLCYGVRIS